MHEGCSLTSARCLCGYRPFYSYQCRTSSSRDVIGTFSAASLAFASTICGSLRQLRVTDGELSGSQVGLDLGYGGLCISATRERCTRVCVALRAISSSICP